MSNYDIDTAVEDTLEHMWQALNGRLNFLATHFSCGTPGVPGYIMQSAARAQQCPFADWAGADQSLHADVLIRHARQFQRSITVPALLAEHYDATGKSVVITLKVRDRSNVPLLIKKEDNTGYVCFHIQISKTLASVLCPRELPERYLKSLYEDARDKLHSDRRTEGDLRSFDLPRYEAFGMLIHRSKNLEQVVKDLFPKDDGETFPKDDAETKTKRKAWRLLGILQSALLYFEGGRKTNDPTPTSGFACAIPLAISDTLPAMPFGFCLGSPVQDITRRYHEVSDLLIRHLWAPRVYSHVLGENLEAEIRALRNAVAKLSYMKLGDVEKIQEALESEINNNGVVRFDGQKKRLLLTGLWLIYLVSKLSGAKHEGKPLDFWFLAGEQTEFADDPDVRLDKQPLRIKVGPNTKPDEVFSLDKFGPDGNGLKLNGNCGLIVRSLEKEHYPWFSQGRCCLFFFDISTEKLKPSGLGELRLGSWNRLVTESLKLPDEQELNIPACLIAFANGASGEAGLLVCYPQGDEGYGPRRGRVKRILRMTGGRWQCHSDTRRSTLEEHFRDRGPWLEGRATRMSEIATMLADDINAGGTLVFLSDDKMLSNEDKLGPFIQLGASWEFEGLQQDKDKIALISHDGATVVWKHDTEIKMAYRQLLAHGKAGDVSDNGNVGNIRGIIEILQEKCLSGNDAQFPLLGAGTRRWNAALCALRNGVNMVVVISTDGDITCWWARNGQQRQFWYHHIPVEFDPNIHERRAILAPATKGPRKSAEL